MKIISFIVLFSTFRLILFAQNLVQNPSFDQNNLEINCSSWYNGCGEALTLHCDSIGYCGVGFSQQSPSIIPENRWSVKIDGGFPNAYVMQHFTNLQGTLVFKLQTWYKPFIPSSSGKISIGKTINGQYLESKYKFENASDWTLVSLTDTISLNQNDTLSILLAGELGDFVFKQTLYEDIFLVVLETLSVDKTQIENLDVFFDESNFILTFNNKSMESFDFKIVNILGQNVFESSENMSSKFQLDLSFLKQELYVIKVKQKNGAVLNKRIVKL